MIIREHGARGWLGDDFVWWRRVLQWREKASFCLVVLVLVPCLIVLCSRTLAERKWSAAESSRDYAEYPFVQPLLLRRSEVSGNSTLWPEEIFTFIRSSCLLRVYNDWPAVIHKLLWTVNSIQARTEWWATQRESILAPANAIGTC